jgi:hypothetical protein
MMAYTPLGGKQGLSLGLPHFSASWPVIGTIAGAIIMVALVAALLFAFVPRHGARHAYGPRHARPENISADKRQRAVTGALKDGPVFPQSLPSIAVETRPDNSGLPRWAQL